MFKVVATSLPPSGAPISGVVRSGPFLQAVVIPRDPVTGTLVQGDIAVQSRAAFHNLRSAVQAAGGSLADVTMVQVFLIDSVDFHGMNEAWQEAFPAPPFPARATVVVKELLVPGLRIELVVTGYLGPA